MTPRTATTVLLLAAGLAALLAAPVARGELALTLTLEKSEVGLGEPVYALVTLVNRGEEAVEVYADLSLGSGLLEIDVQPPEGPALPFVPLAIDDVELAPTTLAAGDEVREVVELFYGGRGWTFDRAGSWKVSAVYEPPGGEKLSAGPVTLTVANTAAGLYLLGAEPKTAAETGKFMVWMQGDHLKLAQRHLRGLLDKHPDADLASYARLALGLNLAEPFRNFAQGTTRPPQWQEALELLGKVDPEALPASLDLRLWGGRLEGAIVAKKAGDARAALAAAREATEGRPDLQEKLEKLLARLPPLPQPPDEP